MDRRYLASAKLSGLLACLLIGTLAAPSSAYAVKDVFCLRKALQMFNGDVEKADAWRKEQLNAAAPQVPHADLMQDARQMAQHRAELLRRHSLEPLSQPVAGQMGSLAYYQRTDLQGIFESVQRLGRKTQDFRVILARPNPGGGTNFVIEVPAGDELSIGLMSAGGGWIHSAVKRNPGYFSELQMAISPSRPGLDYLQFSDPYTLARNVMSLRKDGIAGAPPFGVRVFQGGEYPIETGFKNLAEGYITVAADPAYYVHDVSAHFFGFLAMPDEFMYRILDNAKLDWMAYTDPVLSKNPSFKQQLLKIQEELIGIGLERTTFFITEAAGTGSLKEPYRFEEYLRYGRKNFKHRFKSVYDSLSTQEKAAFDRIYSQARYEDLSVKQANQIAARIPHQIRERFGK